MMQRWQLAGLLLAGLLLVVVSVLLRARYGERYGLTTVDLVLLVVPLIIALLFTGKLRGLEIFGVKVPLEEIFADAATTTIERQVAAVPSPGVEEIVSSLEMATKGGVRAIPELRQKNIQALVFRLGHGGYFGPAIQTYLEALIKTPNFRYLIVQDRRGKFFGMYDASALGVYFRKQGKEGFEEFARWLNRGDEEAKRRLAGLPGFIGAEQAISKTTSKREALKRMDKLQVESLPVVDEAGAFVGTVERSRLTAGLILEVLDRLEGGGR